MKNKMIAKVNSVVEAHQQAMHSFAEHTVYPYCEILLGKVAKRLPKRKIWLVPGLWGVTLMVDGEPWGQLGDERRMLRLEKRFPELAVIHELIILMEDKLKFSAPNIRPMWRQLVRV